MYFSTPSGVLTVYEVSIDCNNCQAPFKPSKSNAEPKDDDDRNPVLIQKVSFSIFQTALLHSNGNFTLFLNHMTRCIRGYLIFTEYYLYVASLHLTVTWHNL